MLRLFCIVSFFYGYQLTTQCQAIKLDKSYKVDASPTNIYYLFGEDPEQSILVFDHNKIVNQPFDDFNPVSTQTSSYYGFDNDELNYLFTIEGSSGIRSKAIGYNDQIESSYVLVEGNSSVYGYRPLVTRISGQGSGGTDLRISKQEREFIIRQGTSFNGSVRYEVGGSPIGVKILKPFLNENKKYRLEILGNTISNSCVFDNDATWVLTDLDTGKEFFSETDLSVNNEQVITGEGFSLSVNHVAKPTTGIDFCGATDPGLLTLNNGSVNQRVEYTDPIQQSLWYEIMPEQIIISGQNIIIDNDYVIDKSSEQGGLRADPDSDFSAPGSNLFQPFYHMSNRAGVVMSPASQDFNLPNFQREEFCQNRRLDTLKLSDLNNVDIVFTPNKDLWSRCIVVEGANSDNLGATNTIGSVNQFELRQSNSVGKDGNEDGDGIGMGWFPGYAINVENGQRLNIFFAENSASPIAIGQDMIWNPNDKVLSDDTGSQIVNDVVVAGGNHYVYVTRSEYDECASFRTFLEDNPSRADVAAVTSQITWASFPKLMEDQSLLSIEDGLIPNELTVSCRVNNPFGLETYVNQNDINSCATLDGNPVYEFSLDGFAPVSLNAVNIYFADDQTTTIVTDTSQGRTLINIKDSDSIYVSRLFTNENTIEKITSFDSLTILSGVFKDTMKYVDPIGIEHVYFSENPYNGYLLAIKEDGTPAWNYLSRGNGISFIRSVQANDGLLYFAHDIVFGTAITALDQNGNLQFNHYMNGVSVHKIDFDSNGKMGWCGNYANFGSLPDMDPSQDSLILPEPTSKDVFLMKFDENQSVEWFQTIGGDLIDTGTDFNFDEDDGIYLTGCIQADGIFDNGTEVFTANGLEDVFLAHYSKEGNYDWNYTFGGNSSDIGLNVQSDEKNIYLFGLFRNEMDIDPNPLNEVILVDENDEVDESYFYAKFNPRTVSSKNLETEYTSTVFPNPTSGIIHFNHHTESVIVYNLKGQKVFENKTKSSNLNLSHLDNGIYLVQQLFEDGRTQISKIELFK